MACTLLPRGEEAKPQAQSRRRVSHRIPVESRRPVPAREDNPWGIPQEGGTTVSLLSSSVPHLLSHLASQCLFPQGR